MRLRKTRRETPAFRLQADGTIEETVSTALRAGDRVVVEAGQIIPGDGEIIEGVASVDESAITGESAPVIREAGGDRSGVTGGTRVLSDRIVVEITASAGKSFLDRMIALVEGAIRQRTPNEIALSLVLSAFTLIFLIVTAALWPMALNAELYMKDYLGLGRAGEEPGHRRADAGGAAGLPDSDDDRRLAGGHRHRRHGPGTCGPTSWPRAARRSKWPATSIRCCWTRPARSRSATAGRRSLCRSTDFSATDVGPAGGAGLGGRPDARRQEHRRAVSTSSKARRAAMATATVRAERRAVRRVHRPDADERRRSGRTAGRFAKGRPTRSLRYVKQQNGVSRRQATETMVADVASKGATPLLVCEGNRIAGMVVLEDILKPGIRERFERLRRMGLRTVMVTGDNPLTAAAIAAQAGVDDFIAEATPEAKLAYIRKEQAGGKLVAMMGDGTNDAPALAQADVGVAMNSGTQAAKEAGNMVDLDSDPTKLIEVVEIGKQLLMTRGALTTFSIANDLAKYFAIIPALFAATLPWLKPFDIMNLHSATSAILSAVIFNAIIIPLLIPIALKGVKYRPVGADALLRRNLLIWGLGGVIVPFVGIKLIDVVLVGLAHGGLTLNDFEGVRRPCPVIFVPICGCWCSALCCAACSIR